MAILNNHGGIYGKAGTVVYRRYRGMTVVQGRPGPRKKKSLSSKAAACEFGLASTTAAIIREALAVSHRELNDGGLVNRCNSAVYRSILASRDKGRGSRDIHDGDVSYLEGLEFNIRSRFSDILKVKPEVYRNAQGQVTVKVPEIDGRRDIRAWVRQIEGGRYVLKFVLIAFNFREEFYEYVGIRELSFLRSSGQKATELVFDREIPPGCFLTLACSLTFERQSDIENKWESVNSLDFNPGTILATFPTEGEAEEGYGKRRIGEALKAGKETGDHYMIRPLSGYAGKGLLSKMKGLTEKISRRGKKHQRVFKAEPEEPVPLEGKRVKF